MIGLKENVIIGKLIPAGTGMRRYRDVQIDITGTDDYKYDLAHAKKEEPEVLDMFEELAEDEDILENLTDDDNDLMEDMDATDETMDLLEEEPADMTEE